MYVEGLSMKDLSYLKPFIRLSIGNPESGSTSAFGLGVANLCMGVRELGSLNAAAKSMGMAYSKAWRIMKETEAALDVQILDRDGAHGSQLTEEGNRILDTYFALVSDFQAESSESLKKFLQA